jgi:hypothetical protein
VPVSEKAQKWLPQAQTQQRLSQWLCKLFNEKREGEIDQNEASNKAISNHKQGFKMKQRKD